MLNYRNAAIVSVIGVLSTLAIAYYGWSNTEAGQQVPVHFGVDGEADRFGSRFEAFFVLPLTLAGVCLLLAVIPRIDPRRTGMEKSVKAYSATWMAVVVFMVFMSAFVTRATLSESSTSIEPRVVLAGLGVLFIVLGNYLPKTGSNWFFGLRTPWTLSSEEVWTATHAIGGPVLMAVGAVCALTALVLPLAWATGVAIVLPLGALVGLTVYSYRKYQQVAAAGP